MAGEDKQAAIEERKQDVYSPMTISVDDIDLEGVDKEKDADEIETKTEDELEIEVEGKEKTVDTEESEVSKLRSEVSSLKGEILKLVSQKPDKVIEPKDDKKEKLTHSQIVGILKENKDADNFSEILANVVKYIAEDTASEIKNKTMEEVSHKQWASNLSGLSSQILSSDDDGYLAANPKIKGELDDMAKNMGLSDHPVGKLAAYSIYRLIEGNKAIKEKGAKGDITKGSETRTRTMDKTRISAQTGKVALSPTQLAVAKKFGVKAETYAKFVKKS